MHSLLKITGFTLLIFFLAQCQDQEAGSNTQTTPDAIAPANALFQTVSPQSSGIDFSNNITEDFTNNIVTNSYLYNGGGVAIADFNNDGLEDLFLSLIHI